MLRHRLFSASILIGCLLVFVGLDASAYNFGCPGLWLLPMGAYLFFGSAVEAASMASRSSRGSIAWPSLTGCAAIMLASCSSLFLGQSIAQDSVPWTDATLAWPAIVAAIVLVGCFGWYLVSFEPQNGNFQRAILSGWVACYFGLGFSAAIALRRSEETNYGLFLLIGFVLVTKLADTGAYFTGRSLGRTKLIPNVSPNKTVEGLIGGVVFSCIGAWCYFGLFAGSVFGGERSATGWIGIVTIGLGMTFAGLVGDLLESAFKREMDCKDSGKLLPGLGGLWDVTDSLLPALAVGYCIVKLGLLGA